MGDYVTEEIFLEEVPNSHLLKEELEIEEGCDVDVVVKEEGLDIHPLGVTCQEHFVRHHEEEPFKCDQCPKSYKCKRSLCQHKSLVHSNKSRVPCELCGKSFPNRAELKRHMKSHSTEKNHKCSDCDYAAKRRGDLIKHININHPTETPFHCKVCSKSFSTLSILKLHSVKHNEEKPFKCDQCSEAFKWKHSLNNHKVFAHSDGGDFPCEVCGKKLLYKVKYKLHMARHNKEKNYKCSDCGYASKYKRDLTNHIKILHPTETSFECEVCSKSFSTLPLLKQHSLKHDETAEVETFEEIYVKVEPTVIYDPEEKRDISKIEDPEETQEHIKGRNHKCRYCGCAFKSKTTLCKHYIVSHPDEAPFQCEVCLKSFPTLLLLKKHSAGHKEAKPFKCDQCSVSCKQKKSLDYHKVIVHGDGGRFACEVCGKKFLFPAKLKDHMENHSSEKSHKCGECDRAFKRKYELNWHIKATHATETPLQCKLCLASFSTLPLLKEHSSIHEESNPFDGMIVKVEPEEKLDVSYVEVKEEPEETDLDEEPEDMANPSETLLQREANYGVSNPVNYTFQDGLKRKLVETLEEIEENLEPIASYSPEEKRPENSEPPFRCEVCFKIFSRPSHLRIHSVKHNEEKPFKCDQCSEAYKRKNNLDYHKAIVHDNKGRFSCEVCGKKFLFQAKLNDHMERHSSEKNHKCMECGRAFKTKYELICHIDATHATVTRFQCEVCSKRFPTSGRLKAHSVKHSEERPFECDQCSEAYKRKSNLDNHKAIVHDNKGRYSCGVCGWKFLFPAKLEEHMKKHSKEKNGRKAFCSVEEIETFEEATYNSEEIVKCEPEVIVKKEADNMEET